MAEYHGVTEFTWPAELLRRIATMSCGTELVAAEDDSLCLSVDCPDAISGELFKLGGLGRVRSPSSTIKTFQVLDVYRESRVRATRDRFQAPHRINSVVFEPQG